MKVSIAFQLAKLVNCMYINECLKATIQHPSLQRAARMFEVKSFPTFAFFRNGEVLDKVGICRIYMHYYDLCSTALKMVGVF